MNDIQRLVGKLRQRNDDEVYLISNKLAAIGGQEVVAALIPLLRDTDPDVLFLAARTLSRTKDNQRALEPLLEMISDSRYEHSMGTLVQALEGFDLSDHFLTILNIYLNGTFKASGIAKHYLDYKEFNVDPQLIEDARDILEAFRDSGSDDPQLHEKSEQAEMIVKELSALFE